MSLRKGLEFQLTYLIASVNRPISLGEILRYYPGISETNTDQINYYLDSLINDNYLVFKEGGYCLTAKGIAYFERYHIESNRLIFNGKLDLAVMKFLYDMNTAVAYNQFPMDILDHAPEDAEGRSREFHLQNYLRHHSVFKNYFSTGKHFITLNESGKSYYDLLIRKEAETKIAEKELQNKSLKQENRSLRQELKDYKWTKFERNVLVIIAVIFLLWAMFSTLRPLR